MKASEFKQRVLVEIEDFTKGLDLASQALSENWLDTATARAGVAGAYSALTVLAKLVGDFEDEND